ncbi:tripartite motif-containing protein 3-like [Branchiostoma lanceolatum]|uniref:tripartite motif-containing protein 3-like n=1 Tax=Branchiostoma lanceolatum TaxID=7740 RepID=UPI0034562F55
MEKTMFTPRKPFLASAHVPAVVKTDSLYHSEQIQNEKYVRKLRFGEEGIEQGQFLYPVGVTVSVEGEIFIADSGNQRIQVFTLQGTFVRQFPTVLSGRQNMQPHDMALDGEGNLWVVGNSMSANFAVRYNKHGKVLKKIDLQFTVWERGVTVDTRRNHILITRTTGDWYNTRAEVQVFRPDGTLIKTSCRQQGMRYPQNITVDGKGNILVTDYENACVYVYDEDGQFLFQFGGEGSGESQLQYPHGICTDRAGNIIMADSENGRVELFDETGKFLQHIATDMQEPWAVAMATQRQLVVTDVFDVSVSVFQTFGNLSKL